MQGFGYTALAGFAGGVVRAVWGWAKSRRNGEVFNAPRFICSLIEAGLTGAVCGIAALNPIAAFFAGAGATSLADKLLAKKQPA